MAKTMTMTMTPRTKTPRALTALVVLGALALPAPRVDARGEATISTELTLTAPTPEGASGAATLLATSDRAPALAGFVRSDVPAQPALPHRLLTVALHPDADLRTLKITLKRGPVASLPGSYRLAPNPPFRFRVRGKALKSWGRAEAVVGGRDVAAYGAAPFPARELTRAWLSNYRGQPLLTLRYRPLRYRHDSGELLLTRQLRATLSYRLVSSAPANLRARGGKRQADTQLATRLARVANAPQARGWYAKANSTAPLGYAIIIPDALRKASSKLDAFIAHKQALGFKVFVSSDAELAQVQIGKDDGDPQRIRGWLQQRYKALNLAYALLIGNPTSSSPGAPMMLAHTVENHSSINEITPTDHYYAELTGTWDKDGDGKVAEYPQDGGEGGMDFEPELLVGRVPVYDDNVAVLDDILAKTIRYEQAKGDLAWRGRVLQPAAMLFLENQYGQSRYARQDGADQADAVYKQVIAPAGWGHTSLYERDGQDPSKLPSDGPLDTETVVKEWNRGYGIVNLFGHGSAHGIYRLLWTEDNGDKVPGWGELAEPSFLSYGDIMRLTNERPAVVFHMSCSNGTPERPDNLAYGLLRHGAVATAAASRVAIVPDIASGPLAIGMSRDFVRELIAGKTTGEALFAAKAAVLEYPSQIGWYTMLQYNLYGDPSLRIARCSADADCDDGKVCNGAERCTKGLCQAGKAVDCASADPCTEARCEEPTGTCSKLPRPDGERCDDGLFCTVSETCQAGACVGKPRCSAADNPCVAGVCSEVTRSCDVEPLMPEGQRCRAGSSREGACRAGLCEPDNDGCAVAKPGGNTGLPWLGGLLLLWVLWRRRRR
jgi:hypothetical protein